jgi:hypothetical protein
MRSDPAAFQEFVGEQVMDGQVTGGSSFLSSGLSVPLELAIWKSSHCGVTIAASARCCGRRSGGLD